MLGRRSAWSEKRPSETPCGFTPGPTRDALVVVTSGEIVPRFQANMGLTATQADWQLAGPRLREESGVANRTADGVRGGSAVVVCRSLLETGWDRGAMRGAVPVVVVRW